MATLKHPHRPCRCGRLVNAGRTQTHPDQSQCLICETAQVMATFVYPPRPPWPDGELFPPPPEPVEAAHADGS